MSIAILVVACTWNKPEKAKEWQAMLKQIEDFEE
jgi:hypothetical protein